MCGIFLQLINQGGPIFWVDAGSNEPQAALERLSLLSDYYCSNTPSTARGPPLQ